MTATASRGPLAGIGVLDLSSVGPASRATRLLADYGADVIKISPLPSADGVQIAPPYFAYGAHRFMQRIAIDLKAPVGRDCFLELARRADVVVESYRPGVVERMGIGYSTLAATNPGLVYCSTSGFGQDGPLAQRAGHDLNYLAVGGYLGAGEPLADGRPPLPGASIADGAAGGMHAALAIMSALIARASSGVGTYLDVAVADGVLWLMSLAIDDHLATGSDPGFGHDVLSGRYACYGTYLTRDGHAIAVGAIEAKFFAQLCRQLDLDHLASLQYVDDAQEKVRLELATCFASRDLAAWADLLEGLDNCVSGVSSVSDIVGVAQFAHRHNLVTVEHPLAGRFRQVAPVLAGMIRPVEPIAVPDWSRTDAQAVLGAAGFDEERINKLMSGGAVA